MSETDLKRQFARPIMAGRRCYASPMCITLLSNWGAASVYEPDVWMQRRIIWRSSRYVNIPLNCDVQYITNCSAMGVSGRNMGI